MIFLLRYFPAGSTNCVFASQHNRQKFRCKDCYMCVHYRVKSRCSECVAEDMRSNVLMVPRGQAWNMKSHSLEGNAAASAAVGEASASSPTNRGIRKDVRPDARAKNSESEIKSLELGDAGKVGLVGHALGDEAAGEPKVLGVVQEPEWDGEKAHLQQQIETLRQQHQQAVRCVHKISYVLM